MIDPLSEINDLRDELRRLRAELDEARGQQMSAVSGMLRAEVREAELLAACDRMMIGGNHIANWHTQYWPEPGSDPMVALEVLGAGREYDMWCCWNAIMCARAAIAKVSK